ncbi:MAG: hypothetical protein H0V56_02895 [Chthoniobacterales bacterium]|nr:hypothetical protein [Chthoniobacterales bacterium]
MKRLLLCLLWFSLAATVHATEPETAPAFDQTKLVGEWRYVDEEAKVEARYVFRADQSYTSELWRDGELARKFEGTWAVEEGMLVYTYLKDSMDQIQTGARERDRLLRIDESSYSIQAGDGGTRTYFRVKEDEAR